MGLRSILTALALACAPLVAQADGLGWRVTGTDGGTLYLVGTVHAARPDFYPLPTAIDKAFADAEVLALEIDMSTVTPAAASSYTKGHGYLGAMQTLDQLLGADDWTHVVEWGRKLGVPSGALKRMKPWLAGITLAALEMQHQGLDPGLGMDRHFTARAMKRRMPVVGLETLEQQLGALSGLSMKTQVAFLENSLTTTEVFAESLKTIIDSWVAGDGERLAQVLDESYEGAEEVYDALMRARNARWLPKIEAMLASDRTHFVAVGALHLVGEDGLVAMLEAAGYELEPL